MPTGLSPELPPAPRGRGIADEPDGKTINPDEISELGLTAALPQTGTLRPTLVVAGGWTLMAAWSLKLASFEHELGGRCSVRLGARDQ